jgi:hypothetical protein
MFTYGTVLCIAALYLAGFGHGSYLLLALAGAPFSPLQWGLLAILQRRWKRAPIFVIGFLILHYASAGFAVRFLLDPEDTDFQRLNGMLHGFTTYLTMSVILYVGGQIVLWSIALKGLSANRAESRNVPV